MKAWTIDTFVRVLDRTGGLSEGRETFARWARDLAPRCSSPVAVDVTARPERDGPRRAIASSQAAFLDLQVRCRQCDACRRLRASEWRWRADRELRYAVSEGRRSWFVTLTFRPGSRYRLHALAIALFNARGRDPEASSFEGLEASDQLKLVERQAAREVNLFLKRLRKNTGCVFRYLCAAEAHRTGDVHYHLLIHEVSGSIGERMFRREWRLGFAHAKLVRATETEEVASYATKVARYVSKQIEARVRASLRYGEPLAGEARRTLLSLVKREDSPSKNTIIPNNSVS